MAKEKNELYFEKEKVKIFLNKKNNEIEDYTLIINGAFGTGKTTFLNNFFEKNY